MGGRLGAVTDRRVGDCEAAGDHCCECGMSSDGEPIDSKQAEERTQGKQCKHQNAMAGLRRQSSHCLESGGARSEALESVRYVIQYLCRDISSLIKITY